MRVCSISKKCKRIPRLAAMALLVLHSSATRAETNDQSFSTRPDECVLLLGDHTVARTAHLTQRFFPAAKHPANPVMRRAQAWEGVGPYLFGSRLMQDAATRQLRMWYITYNFEGNFYRWGYATSVDGLKWTRPDLGVERFGNT